jgi:hypothetical protein
VAEVFASAGLPPPVRIGTVVAGAGLHLAGPGGATEPLPRAGWEHPVP